MSQHENNGMELATIDHATGEIFQQEEEEISVIYQDSRNIPEHLRELTKLVTVRGFSPEDATAILGVYENVSFRRKFSRYVGQSVNILGCIVWWHDAFISNKEGTRGQEMPGFSQILFLTDKTDQDTGDPIVLEASYGSLANHVRGILSGMGWYLFDAPVEYKLYKDPERNNFGMQNQKRVNEMLEKMKRATGKKTGK